MEPDFSGWATKANLKCSDGRIIMPDAFAHQDKVRVPLVWSHNHDDIENVLGHVMLEAVTDGVRIDAFLNDTPKGKATKQIVQHGDVDSLSIWANELTEKVIQGAKQVFHGAIKEVSLVLSGANPGAKIDFINIAHSDGTSEELVDEAIITTGLPIELRHAEGDQKVEDNKSETKSDDEKKSEADGDKTVQEVLDSLDDTQMGVVEALIGEALASKDSTDGTDKKDEQAAEHSDMNNNEESLNHQEGTTMNVFDRVKNTGATERPTLAHDAMKKIVEFADNGSRKFSESLLAHAEEYGIQDIELLFPDARALTNTPEFVKRRTEWVAEVLSGTNHTPFSRVKTLTADITQESARAKGYIKGTYKKDEFFGLTRRITTPTTVYKKQKLDRDDVLDITEIDVIAWLKAEMRLMLEEEIARAVLFGDGREVDDEDKIKEPSGLADGAGIRSIAHDNEFYAHKVELPSNVSGQDLIEAILRGFVYYRGSGNPTFFTTQPLLVDLLLAKDKLGRRYYNTTTDLAAAMGVSKVVAVEALESEPNTLGVIVNLRDYTIGADKGGSVTMFDDFDIDFNQMKYLIETRISGALTKWKSALVITRDEGTEVTPEIPAFNAGTGVVTIPAQAGVVYKNKDTDAVLASGAQAPLAAGNSIEVVAEPAADYYFPHLTDADWEFTRPA